MVPPLEPYVGGPMGEWKKKEKEGRKGREDCDFLSSSAYLGRQPCEAKLNSCVAGS